MEGKGNSVVADMVKSARPRLSSEYYFFGTGIIVGILLGSFFMAKTLYTQRKALASSSSKSKEKSKESNKQDDGSGEDNDEDDDEEEEEEDDNDGEDIGEPLKMVLVVRNDLGMSKGKMCAQCGHATLGAYQRAKKEYISAWTRSGQAKIALKCNSEEELLEIAKKCKELKLPHYVVADAGRTQIAAGSLTVCGIGPAPESEIDKVTKQLKLM